MLDFSDLACSGKEQLSGEAYSFHPGRRRHGDANQLRARRLSSPRARFLCWGRGGLSCPSSSASACRSERGARETAPQLGFRSALATPQFAAARSGAFGPVRKRVLLGREVEPCPGTCRPRLAKAAQE